MKLTAVIKTAHAEYLVGITDDSWFGVPQMLRDGRLDDIEWIGETGYHKIPVTEVEGFRLVVELEAVR